MFEATRARSRWPGIVLGLLAVGVAVGVVRGGRDLLDRASVLAAGGNPLADPLADRHVDVVYPESPLAVSLALESGLGPVDRDGVLAFADALARELGTWLLAETGADDIEAAEVALWARDGEPDAFAVKWALLLQQREVYNRDSQRLSAGVPAEGYRYAHPDELALLFAHVAWRLDLAVDLERSPVHLYALWREPGGTRVRGVEPTCFRRVDALGALTPSDEPSVGRRLTFPRDHYVSGAGGVRNPKDLPRGTYAPIGASALPGELLARLAARYGGGIDVLERKLTESPDPAVAGAVFRARLAEGIAAWERGDASVVARDAEALAQLRVDHGGLLDPAPEERALAAAVAFAAGDEADGLAHLDAVFGHHEPRSGPGAPLLYARSDAHAMAMWLELEHRSLGPDGWNRRMVPLLNRYRADPARMAALCGLGRPLLTDVTQTIEALVPECAGR